MEREPHLGFQHDIGKKRAALTSPVDLKSKHAVWIVGLDTGE